MVSRLALWALALCAALGVQAAEVAGVSRAEFLEALRRFHVTPFQLSPEELLAELENGN